MRLIDADKLYPDCLTKNGTLAISQSQLANAPTVEYTFEEAFQKTVCDNKLYCPKRPQGKWICDYRTCRCSVCNFTTVIDTYNYCPNCGSYMKCDNDILEEDAKQASIPYSYQMPKNYIKYKLDYLHHDSITKSDTQI